VPNVSNLVKTIQDIMRKDAGVDGDGQRLELETELYRRAA
jgi:type I restriction enzyme M protein